MKTSSYVCVDINLLSKKNWIQELKAVFASVCTFGIVYRHLLFAKAFDLIGSYVIDMVTKTVHRALAEPAETLQMAVNTCAVARIQVIVSCYKRCLGR